MTDRLARFSVTFDGDPDGTVDALINAGSGKGFTVTAVSMKVLPEDMTSSADVPYVSTDRFTSAASGGTAATVFGLTDGDTPSAGVLINPTTLGTHQASGPQFWPGVASYTGSVWYLHGTQHLADFGADQIYVAPNHSLRVRAAKLVSATIYFNEHLAS